MRWLHWRWPVGHMHRRRGLVPAIVWPCCACSISCGCPARSGGHVAAREFGSTKIYNTSLHIIQNSLMIHDTPQPGDHTHTQLQINLRLLWTPGAPSRLSTPGHLASFVGSQWLLVQRCARGRFCVFPQRATTASVSFSRSASCTVPLPLQVRGAR